MRSAVCQLGKDLQVQGWCWDSVGMIHQGWVSGGSLPPSLPLLLSEEEDTWTL